MAQNGTFQKWTVTIQRKPVISLLGDGVISIGLGCKYIRQDLLL
jgi:hypothetical protein